MLQKANLLKSSMSVQINNMWFREFRVANDLPHSHTADSLNASLLCGIVVWFTKTEQSNVKEGENKILAPYWV